MPAWFIFASALAYLLLLFAIASIGDRRREMRGQALKGQPVIYALSLAIYCTSWTYFGSVGLAAERGAEFLAIYIGPMLMFTIGLPVVRRIITLAKAERLTSIADFIAARYGKNPTVAGLVTLIAVIGVVPYIALQLKAVASSVSAMVETSSSGVAAGGPFFTDISFVVTLGLAVFAVIFGTRHTDATEHQNGLILAVAAESVVKLAAITTAGLFVVYGVFDGPTALIEAARQNEQVNAMLAYETSPERWATLILLSAFAILMLPRQFHVTVVENRSPEELRLARYLFPAYLIAINLFVIPFAIGGIIHFSGGGEADLYVLSLPIAYDMPAISLLTFIGGFSAATAMVIVASVAIAIMISNDLVMPVFLRQNYIRHRGQPDDFRSTILTIRRTAILVTLLLGYAYYRVADMNAGLASIGLLSFAAIAQMAPALFGGLIWRNANARGAIAGLAGGITVWVLFLLIPSMTGTPHPLTAEPVFATLFPSSDYFGSSRSDPFVNAVVLSLVANTALFIIGSLTRAPKPLERMQAGVFIPQPSLVKPLSGRWKTRVTVADLKSTVVRYLGAERTERSFATYEQNAGRALDPSATADMALVRFAEQLLGSAIGSASARLVLSLVFQKTDDTSAETARLLDEASEALQYNRDLLQTALGEMDQGITVFDKYNRLTMWNRQFRALLDLPESVGQVGYRLEDIISILAERGDLREVESQRVIERFLTMDQAFALTVKSKNRIIEIRSNPMPDSGVVTTYADITQRVESDKALKRANETLEARVEERTGELVRVNEELAKARALAEEANLGKTRFLAAAGHDILQPLNAARLYTSSLVERLGESENRELVGNIDSSLESVESILGAVLDISRLDTGAMKPQISNIPLDDMFRRIATDFAPVAREKNLRFTVMPTRHVVRSDPNLLRRLIQNLVSNAIKYTPQGRVLIGARRNGEGAIQVQVIDTGIGIPASQFNTVFREFTRLDEGMRTASGLGLGLSIVDRIARVLSHPVRLDSHAGKGTDFRVEIPLADDASAVMTRETTARPVAVSTLAGMHVICIDNEPAIVDGMTRLLGGWGCLVARAHSREMALAIEGEPEARPDAIIADYHLDDGTGIDTILELRKRWNHTVPAVLVTADRSQEVRQSAETHGIDIINKPVRPAALRAWLNRIAFGRRDAAE